MAWTASPLNHSGALCRLDEVSAVPMGFPREFLASQEMRQGIAGGKLELIDFPTATVA
jgi:hypothetical protein